jgi:hypothetical protein
MLTSNIIKWIPKKSSALFNGGQNMKPCFLMLIFGATKFYVLLGHKLRLKELFFSRDTYKLEEMSFIMIKFRKIDVCEQKLTT